ncbi:hemerythrin domain-containing protein [Kitasatospora viridis]|uniref:Hemerythrin HHE cation binding domain-containing protein n=1 Tax=Kitasatospora viridis TaxID=281105 RepID=A0A561UPH9_9ACTN|nr:hemerythrin domain-containing protein [Kitasatospora viridis]TWG01244.1 hemerythrin HHE cation binding domain-containing protein [Kitasatospora viridis]
MSTDAIVLLKQEHKELLRLFKAYHAADPGDRAGRADLAQHIVHDLTIHSYLVDEVLNPVVVELLHDPAHPAVLGFQDHRAIDRLCEEVADRGPADPGFEGGMAELLTAAVRQMEREERDWFPLLRAALRRKDLQDIGLRLLAVRETAPRHPPGPVSGASSGAPG